MPTPRIGERAGRVPAPLRRARTYLFTLATLLSLSGCVLETAAEEEARVNGTDKVAGAVVKANKTQIKAGETVTLDVSGSKFAGSKVCPTSVLVFADDDIGRDADILDPKVADCALAPGNTVDVTLGAGAPGVRTQTIRVAVNGVNPDPYEEAISEAKIDIKVETPLPNGAPPARLTEASKPTPMPTPTPTPTPAPGSPEKPNAHFVVNPWQPVRGEVIWLDGSLSHDPDGEIKDWHWELDGDGKFDDHSGLEASTLAPLNGPLEIGLRVVDNGGNTHERLFELSPILQPAGYLTAKPLTQQGPARADGTSVGFTPADIAGVDEFAVDKDQNGSPDTMFFGRSMGNPPTLFTTFARAGAQEVDFIYRNSTSGEQSSWTMIVLVHPAARAGDRTRVVYAGKRFKGVKTTATMKLKAKLMKMGKVGTANGELRVKGLLVRGTINGKIPRSAAKVAPAKLRGLYKSEYVGSFTGERVRLTPDAWTMKGKGTILARPRNDRKTFVCLSVKADGTLDPKGSTWKVIGASGNARGFTAKGTFTPALVGMPLPAAANQPTTLDVRAGGGKPLSAACKALARQLPGAKKARKK